MGLVSIDEANNLITICYSTGTVWDEVVLNLGRSFEDVAAPYRYDWLLDLRSVSGKPRLIQLERLGKKWEGIAKGRDVGRRTAVVNAGLVSPEFIRHSELIWPFRRIRTFNELGAARAWLWSVAPCESDQFQLI